MSLLDANELVDLKCALNDSYDRDYMLDRGVLNDVNTCSE